jgi:hypothetical protein
MQPTQVKQPFHRDGHDPSQRPLRDRRARLEDAVAGGEFVFPVRRLTPDGLSQSPDRPGGRGGGLETQTHCWATVTPSPCRW